MIIAKQAQLTFKDRRAIWSELRRYQNVSFVADEIIHLQQVPVKHRSNARKQAEQIRFCLIQAAEYFAAAEAVSSATKPVLLYYGTMSLALAEILFKQDGGSSLDKARGQNAHHGLTFLIDGVPCKQGPLAESGEALRAKPLVGAQGARFGTFELWHRSSREYPVCGLFEKKQQNGTSISGVTVVAGALDERLALLPDQGLSLLDCFRALPELRHRLNTCGIESEGVRATWHRTIEADDSTTDLLLVHPNSKTNLDALLALLKFRSFALEQINTFDVPGGIVVQWTSGPNHPGPHFNMPMSTQTNAEDVHFSTKNFSLNEFGLLYAGMFILGNYARYHPEQWMADVESASDLATCSETFISVAEHRAPLLTLSELTRCWYLSG